MNDNIIGYNPEQVKELVKRATKTHAYIQSFLEDRFNEVILKPLSEAWKSPEAKTYGSEIMGVCSKIGDDINKYYWGLIDYIKGIAVRWIGPSDINLLLDDAIGYELDRGGTYFELDAADSNGNVYIDTSKMQEIINNVNNLEMEFQTSLSNYRNNLNTSAAFFGGNMVENINNYYENVLKEVVNVFDFLTEGENNLKSQLEYCLNKYFERSVIEDSGTIESIESVQMPKLDL